MDDDFLKFKDAMDKATPSPSKQAKTLAFDRAMAAFDEVHEEQRDQVFSNSRQGSTNESRLKGQRTRGVSDVLKGLWTMLDQFISRPAMLGTTSLAAIAVAVVVTTNYDYFDPLLTVDRPEVTKEEKPAIVADKDDNAAVSPVSKAARAEPPVVVEAEPLREEIAASPPAPATPPSVKIAPAIAPSPSAGVPKTRSYNTGVNRRAYKKAPKPVGRLAVPAAPRYDASVPNAVPSVVPPMIVTEQSAEKFPEGIINPLRLTSEQPVSTFSIDVDTASYSFVRSAINVGQLPPKGAVRVEELINYFSYDYKRPESAETPFSTSVSVMETPWNTGTKLMQVGIKGYTPDSATLPPHNLVFLIDTSGSMAQPNKLPLLIQSFRLLLTSLRPQDKVAIVTYAGSAGMALEPTSVADTDKIMAALSNLRAGGPTAGQAGLQQAYALAAKMAGDDGKSRVILATDGDFNVGLSDPKALKDFVAAKRKSGAYLSVLGFGRGNYNDALMQSLAQNGNGFAAYIDTLSEARKVLVDQVAGSLTPIANDVKVQVEFSPAQIAEYRLIGYETRALKREDFNNDKVDAGEIGAGHTVTAIYEITPVGSSARKVDTLRYGKKETEAAANSGDDELAFVKLRYKKPGEDKSILITTPVKADRADISETEAKFAAAVAGFGEVLRGSQYTADWSLKDAEALAKAGRGNDPYGYRAEFLSLLLLAQIIKK